MADRQLMSSQVGTWVPVKVPRYEIGIDQPACGFDSRTKPATIGLGRNLPEPALYSTISENGRL